MRHSGPHAQVLVAFRAPSLSDSDFPALVLFDALLAGGRGFAGSVLRSAGHGGPYPRASGTLLDQSTAGLASAVRSDWQVSTYPYVYTLSATVAQSEGLGPAEAALFRRPRRSHIEGLDAGRPEPGASPGANGGRPRHGRPTRPRPSTRALRGVGRLRASRDPARASRAGDPRGSSALRARAPRTGPRDGGLVRPARTTAASGSRDRTQRFTHARGLAALASRPLHRPRAEPPSQRGSDISHDLRHHRRRRTH